jgi:hypothetical protein
MDYKSLEEVIRLHVRLGRKNAKGWEECLHLGCDHGRKGNRAAFLFENGQTAFHCFNCGTKTVYDPDSHTKMPVKMAEVLGDFNVPEDEWQAVLLGSMAARDAGIKAGGTAKQQVITEPKELELPPEFYLLSEADSDDKWAMIATNYLEHERAIDPSSYPFMLSRQTKRPHMKKWRGRVIYPIYKGEKLIYYQGRDLTGRAVKKFESPSDPKDRVIYGFDRLFQQTEVPLYIVEGWFDAHVIDGIALLGNEITPAQISWLNKSQRRKVLIPDRFGDGKRIAEQALELGWEISTPEIGNCKDVNEAVHKYGRMFVMKTIADNTAIGFDAETRLEVYCK